MFLPLIDDLRPQKLPVVTHSLIAINIIVFLWMICLSRENSPSLAAFVERFALTPAHLLGTYSLADKIVPLYTSMFLHAGFKHILGNMLILNLVGAAIEDRIGRVNFLIMYMLCGFIAALGYAASDMHSAMPVLGASGAVFGIAGAYWALFGNAEISVLFTIGIYVKIFQVRASTLFGGFFVLNLFAGMDSLGNSSASEIASWAHIAGFIAGLLLILWFDPGERKPSDENDLAQKKPW